jgi:argininosuccinate synthase
VIAPWRIWVRRCRFTPCWPWVDCAWSPRLKLQYDEPLSNFAVNFNLRHYIWDLNSRTKLIAYAEEAGIPIAQSKRVDAPYSTDANLLHISYEVGFGV